jgi:putative toxin-antitoxin system antitoxin component (TIGR02293 family)
MRPLNEHQLRIEVLAHDVWGDEKAAQKFLAMPHQLLNGQAPIELAATEDGAKQIEEILRKIFWGLPR